MVSDGDGSVGASRVGPWKHDDDDADDDANAADDDDDNDEDGPVGASRVRDHFIVL